MTKRVFMPAHKDTVTPPGQIKTYDQFEGNLDFYNDQRYRQANRLFYEAIELLKDCGMKHNQACDWVSGWGFVDEGD